MLATLLKKDSTVKHAPTGDIIKVVSFTKVFIHGKVFTDDDRWIGRDVKVRISECETYTEPPKKKSAYDLLMERVNEKAQSLPPVPTNIDQSVLLLKQAACQKIDDACKHNPDVCTFRSGSELGRRFGFSEQYVNLLMQYAYNEGHRIATDQLSRHHANETKNLSLAMKKIVDALDAHGFIPDMEDFS
jgi:hypothetical protein